MFLLKKNTYPPLELTANRPCPKGKLSSILQGRTVSFPGRVMSGNLGIGCQPSWSSPLLECCKATCHAGSLLGEGSFRPYRSLLPDEQRVKKYTLKRHPFFESMKNLIEPEFQSVYNMKSKHLFSVSTKIIETQMTWRLPPSGARRRALTRQQGSLPVCCVKTGKWSANVWLAYTDIHIQ